MPDVTGSSDRMELLIKFVNPTNCFSSSAVPTVNKQTTELPSLPLPPSDSLGDGNSLEALTTLAESVVYSQAASDKSCHFLNMKYKSLWLSTVVSGSPFETETELIPYILQFF